MGTNTLNKLTLPHTPIIDDFNQYFTALAGDFIPRNVTTGAPEDNVNKLGRPAFRWKEAHITDLFLGGALFDPTVTGVDTKFAINSGASRTDSAQPDFLRADGTGASATILATTTPLQITANNLSITVSSDLPITSLTVAPSSNNTALVDDTELTGGTETLYTGEINGDPITIDTVGTEISNRVGEYICMKTPTGEFMFCFVEDATTLSSCFRGYFFDDSGDPVVRGVLSNNDTLTIMSLGWVFLENNGTTIDVSYNSPIYSGVEPASPVTDDYWFDLLNRLWKRYDGAVFQQVDRMLIGLVVIDETDCIVARSFDFTKAYNDFSDMLVELESVTEAKTYKAYSAIDVYAQIQEFYAGELVWDIATDLESPQTEAASTGYYLYVTEEGIQKLSDEKPYDRRYDLKGFYHPYQSWRCVGMAYNDSGSDFNYVRSQQPRPDGMLFSAPIAAQQFIELEAMFLKNKIYDIHLLGWIPATDGTSLQGNVGVDATYDTSGYTYATALLDSGATISSVASTDTKIIFTGFVGSAAGELGDIKVTLNNPNSPTRTMGKTQGSYINSAAALVNFQGSFSQSTLNNFNSFRFSNSSGNFEAKGRVVVYEKDII